MNPKPYIIIFFTLAICNATLFGPSWLNSKADVQLQKGLELQNHIYVLRTAREKKHTAVATFSLGGHVLGQSTYDLRDLTHICSPQLRTPRGRKCFMKLQ